MTKVLIADDHPLVCTGLKLFIKYSLDMNVAEVHDGRQVIEYVQNNDVDIVLLDIAMPNMDGLDTLKQLQQIKPGLPVLMLSAHTEDRYALRALKCGASGYLQKGCAVDQLVTAIRTILMGGKYVSPALAERLLVESNNDPTVSLHEKLSDREFQVMRLIASGMKTGEIAEELHISNKTIDTYRRRVLEKMQMKSNLEIMRYALENQIII